LGRRLVAGIVWDDKAGQAAESLPELRSIAAIVRALPPLSASWRHMVDFTAAYYQRSVGEIALSVLPPELRRLDDSQVAARRAKVEKAFAIPRPANDAARLPHLSVDQAEAVEKIRAQAARDPGTTLLLHGVTGSGKTEVYLRAAADALALHRQALVLVPEINLTPQLEARFAERFAGHRIVSLHSGLTPAQRLRSWLAAHLGLADLVLGTRLAVFASLPRLGLIVVDEEHDPSYKQQEGARYSARDLAIYRGKLEGVPVVLGSATPSLETWQRATQGPLCGAQPGAPHRRRIAAGGPPGRHEPRTNVGRRAAGAGPAAGRGAEPAHRGRRTEPRLPQSARLCAGPALRRLRLEERVSALQRVARVPQGRSLAALPPLRSRRARCRARARSAAISTSHRSDAAPSGSRSSSPVAEPARRESGADRPHRRRQHARQGRARGAARRRCTPATSTCWSARR
jgi:hypothetical protein